jgi:hypothetical protein
MHLYNYIWVVLLISRLTLAFLSPKLSCGIDIVLVCLCPLDSITQRILLGESYYNWHPYTCELFCLASGPSTKGIYVLVSFLWEPTVESLGEFPIFHDNGWEICHEIVIELPWFSESLICKLLEAHPQISSVTLLADLLDEKSQKSHRDKSQRKPREWVVNYRWHGCDKTLPYDHQNNHRAADKSVRLIILVRIIMCNI